MAKEKLPLQDRSLAKLRKALTDAKWPWSDVSLAAEYHYALVRSTVYAVIPGRQRNSNAASLIDYGVAAACRVIRRSSFDGPPAT